MIRPIALASALNLVAACATLPDDGASVPPSPDFIEARRIADQAESPEETALPAEISPLPEQRMPLVSKDPAFEAPSPADAVSEGVRAARIEPSMEGYVNAIQVYPFTEGALYRLYASPGQVSDIALQPGETLVSVSAGDTVRWVVGDTVSGSGARARAHILVKPVSAGLSTNLMIATDRRTYHLELTSLESGYMAALSWRYPADQLADLTIRNARSVGQDRLKAAPGVKVDALNFDYRIDGDHPAWRPVRVFDDGRQVFIQMPPGLAGTDAPPLFVTGLKGEAELVNYRVQGNFYIVDHLFEAAELRLGRKPQTVVRIRKDMRSGRSSLFGGRS